MVPRSSVLPTGAVKRYGVLPRPGTRQPQRSLKKVRPHDGPRLRAPEQVSEKGGPDAHDMLQTTKDGERGFRTCAEGVTSPRLKTVFETAARRCDEGAAELEAKTRSLGGGPAASAGDPQPPALSAVRFIAPGPTSSLRSPEWTNTRCWPNASVAKTLQKAPTKQRSRRTSPGCKRDCAPPVPRGEGKSRSHPRSAKSGGPSELVRTMRRGAQAEVEAIKCGADKPLLGSINTKGDLP